MCLKVIEKEYENLQIIFNQFGCLLISREDVRDQFRIGAETNRNICLSFSQISFILFVGNYSLC